MPDMLVRLYALPDLEPALAAMSALGVEVRAARATEKRRVLEWVNERFPFWVAEVEVTLARLPVTCVLAVRGQEMLGFACHDAICPNFFGPTAVLEAERGRGIGRALLLAALHAQRGQGYAYAIIGGVGPAEFYARTVGAVLIEGSQPGIYSGLLS